MWKKNNNLHNNLFFFKNIYPLSKLNKINNKSVVCIQGMGLSAYDVVSQLTEGREGCFLRNSENKFKYIPKFFTYKKINNIKKTSQIDFGKQIFPLLFKEMCFVYLSTITDHTSYKISELDEKAILEILYSHKNKKYRNINEYRSNFLELLSNDIKEAEKVSILVPLRHLQILYET